MLYPYPANKFASIFKPPVYYVFPAPPPLLPFYFKSIHNEECITNSTCTSSIFLEISRWFILVNQFMRDCRKWPNVFWPMLNTSPFQNFDKFHKPTLVKWWVRFESIFADTWTTDSIIVSKLGAKKLNAQLWCNQFYCIPNVYPKFRHLQIRNLVNFHDRTITLRLCI